MRALGRRRRLRPSGSVGRRGSVAAALLCFAGAACDEQHPPAARVVSFSPLGSQIVFELGAGDALVAGDPAPERVSGFDPTLVLVPPDFAANPVEGWRERGIPVVEVAPHGFAEFQVIVRQIAWPLGREADASALLRTRADPLAFLSTESHSARRPVVVPVVSLEPLVLAGGHSPLSDLVQVAGAETTTHGSEAYRLPGDPQSLRRERADLLLVALPRPPNAAERRLAEGLAPLGARVEFVLFDEASLWLGRPIETACRIRGAVVGDRREATQSGCVASAEARARALPR